MPSNFPSQPAELPAEGLPRRTSLGYQINHLARLFEAALRVRIAPHGVAPGQFAQLLALYEHDGMSQSQLCEAVQIDQSTMTHTLRRMERDGLVSRLPSARDGRRNDIWLTDRARQLKSTLIASAMGVNAVATEGIDEANLAIASRVVAQLIENLETHNEGNLS